MDDFGICSYGSLGRQGYAIGYFRTLRDWTSRKSLQDVLVACPGSQYPHLSATSLSTRYSLIGMKDAWVTAQAALSTSTPSHLASYQLYLRSVSYRPESDVSLSVSVSQVLEDCSEAECLAAEGAARAGCLVPAESVNMYPVVFRFDEILQEKGCGDTTA